LRATTGLLYALTIGALLGLGLTWWTLSGGPGFGALSSGPWTAWPRAGTLDADRYARASLSRSGELPLGSGEGITFLAERDNDGARLDGRCQYSIAPIGPPSRWWTLSLYGEGGSLVNNPAERYGFTSSEVIRRGDGLVAVVTGPEVMPGNWLPSAPGRITLALRLYDTPIAASLAANQFVALPSITREACR
jgi:hypothetical protein